MDNLYLAVQKIPEGYGYIFYDNKYNSIAGDIYENPDVSLEYAVRKVLMKEEMDGFRPQQVSFLELFEELKQHSAERLWEDRVPLTSDIGLREKGLKNWSRSEIEAEVLNQTAYALKENGFSLNDEVLLGTRVYGSRTREGLYREDSEINVVLFYQGTIEEERLQNMVNQLGLNVEGIPVNVKPISFDRSGSLAQFVEQAEMVLDQKEEAVQRDIHTQMEKHIECINTIGRSLTAEEKKLILKGANQFDNMESAAPYINKVVSYLKEHGKQGINTERVEDENIQKEPWKEAEKLAKKLMQFAEDIDYYNYSDYLDNRGKQLQDLTGDIFMGKAFGVQDFLYGVIDESAEPESAGRAICLCQDLKDYGEHWKNNLCRQDKQLYSKSDGNRSIKDRLSENRNRIDQKVHSRGKHIINHLARKKELEFEE